jgi:uncharacterized protein YacL
MSSNYICGIKLGQEEKRELTRMEMRNIVSGLLGSIVVVIMATIVRVVLHDTAASINFFAGALFVMVAMIWGHVRYLAAMRIRDELSRKGNKEIS